MAVRDQRRDGCGSGRRYGGSHGASGAGVWTPPQATSATNVLWISGALGLVPNGGFTAGRLDQSGAGHDFTQATAGRQPVTAATYDAYDNVNDFLANADAQILDAGAYTIGCRFKLTAIHTDQMLFQIKQVDGGAASCFAVGYILNIATYPKIAINAQIGAGASASIGFNFTVDTAWHSLLVNFTGGSASNTANYSAYLDNISQDCTGVFGGVLSLSGTDPSSIGAIFQTTPISMSDAAIAQTVAYLGNLNSTERAKLETFLDAS